MNNYTPPKLVHVGVGIDTARYAHHVSFLDEEKRTAAKPFHFTETATGYQKLQDAFDRLAGKHPGLHLHIRIDAAGQYAENLLQRLHQLDLNATISVGQPARNKAYRKVHFDKRKADPTESLACARFAMVERPRATPHNPPEFQQLRDTVALLEVATKQHTRLVNQLHGLLARVFPELAVLVKDLSANWALTLLDKYPTPAKLARAKPETLASIPRLQAEMVPMLQAAAAQSLGSNRGLLAEQLVRQKVRAIRIQEAKSRDLQKLLEKAWKALPVGPYRGLTTIKGIGVQTAAALAAKIVSIDRFPTASSLIGYFGVFPEEVDVSGTDPQGKPKPGTEIHMSRKGNDLVRRLLYTSAQCAAKWNPQQSGRAARKSGHHDRFQDTGRHEREQSATIELCPASSPSLDHARAEIHWLACAIGARSSMARCLSASRNRGDNKSLFCGSYGKQRVLLPPLRQPGQCFGPVDRIAWQAAVGSSLGVGGNPGTRSPSA